MDMYTVLPRNSSRTDRPRAPYPLIWSPRTYGTAFGLAGPGGGR